jgi:hypothetical protein
LDLVSVFVHLTLPSDSLFSLASFGGQSLSFPDKDLSILQLNHLNISSVLFIWWSPSVIQFSIGYTAFFMDH